MSYMKRYYEDHFDEIVTYSKLKEQGLTDYEIFIQWDSFSKKEKTWEEFKKT